MLLCSGVVGGEGEIVVVGVGVAAGRKGQGGVRKSVLCCQ
jgi:hypothetical protein